MKSGPHTHGGEQVSSIMVAVMVALTPATLYGLYAFGWPAINLFIITLATALVGEALCLQIAGKPVVANLADGSAALTGWLLAMSLPPWAPWWIGVLGSLFAIIIGKQIFGGLGQNVFNPAMLARVALLISVPVQLTHWVAPVSLFSASAPGFLESLAHTFGATIPTADGFSSATLLGQIKTGLGQGQWMPQILADGYQPLKAALGSESGSLGETSAVLLLAGGIWLLLRRVISWHIPVAMLGTIALMASLFYMIDPQRHPDPGLYLMSGGLMLGAFFIATDFVTSPSTELGQLIFGTGCGLLVYIIRTWGGYPEGVAFAVLLMNAFTPVIDHYLRPRIYGRNIKGLPRTGVTHNRTADSRE
jgi:H+/Na+-translocating ferredoxin:NAD+ oxidoreductase subunit D